MSKKKVYTTIRVREWVSFLEDRMRLDWLDKKKSELCYCWPISQPFSNERIEKLSIRELIDSSMSKEKRKYRNDKRRNSY